MWAQIVNTILGLWLMAAPALLGYNQIAADNGHIIGPVIVTFSVVAYWEATRVVGKWNFLLGGWLLLAPWILSYDVQSAYISDMGTGILVIIFASVTGNIAQKYGGGWNALWQKDPEHIKELRKRD